MGQAVVAQPLEVTHCLMKQQLKVCGEYPTVPKLAQISVFAQLILPLDVYSRSTEDIGLLSVDVTDEDAKEYRSQH